MNGNEGVVPDLLLFLQTSKHENSDYGEVVYTSLTQQFDDVMMRTLRLVAKTTLSSASGACVKPAVSSPVATCSKRTSGAARQSLHVLRLRKCYTREGGILHASGAELYTIDMAPS